MSEMIERVARAIWTMRAESFPHDNFDDLPEHEKKLARIYARAAIEAMKPTTNGMDVAGVAYLRKNAIDASGCFEAMINAALKEV